MGAVEFTAKIEDGKVSPLHTSIVCLLERFGDDVVLVSVAKPSKKRSDRQNRYYWGVVVKIVRDFVQNTQGEKVSPDEIHAFHLNSVLGVKPITRKVLGKEFIMFENRKTSDMNTQEFTEFIEVIRNYWEERGVEIPDPLGENLFEDFLTKLRKNV